MRTLSICGLVLGAALTLGACSSSSTPLPPSQPPASPAASTPAGGGGGTAVEIKGRAFNPSALSVKVGAKVTWTNNDTLSHTVTFDTGGNTSGTLATGATFDMTFATAGSFPYHCSIHPDMTATITVAP